MEAAKEAHPRTAFGRELVRYASDVQDLAEMSEALRANLISQARFAQLLRQQGVQAKLAANLLHSVVACLQKAQEQLEFLGYTDG
jgi:hypothetical protein